MGMIRNIFEMPDIQIDEYLPKWIIDKYNLCDINFAIKSMHFPEKRENVKIALFRLIFEELLFLQLGLFAIKGDSRVASGISMPTHRDLKKIEVGLGFELTKAQQKAYDDILSDMKSSRVMNRLVDRKSTRLNSSHANISYAVFCLKKKKKYKSITT